jgi:hypothetical protein
MLLEEAVGVRLPRHLNRLIAEIPGVGAAFSMMLPIMGVVAAITIITKLVEKHDELIAKTKEAASASESLVLQQDAESRALSVTSLKLDDQIRKLEHKPAHNFLKEAIEENAIAMDKFAEVAITDMAKVEKASAEAFGILHLISLIGSNLFQGHSSDVSAYADKLRMLGEVADSSQGALDELAKVSPTSPAHNAAVNNAISALKTYAKTSTEAATAAKLVGDNVAMVGFTQAARTANHQVEDLNKQLEASAQHIKIANLEQGKANLEPLEKEATLQKTISGGVLAHLAAQQKLNDTMAEGTAIGNGSKDNTQPQKQLEQVLALHRTEYEDAVKFAKAELDEKEKIYNSEKAATDDPAKKQDLLKAWENTQEASADHVQQAQAESYKKDLEAIAECDREKKRLAQEADNQANKAAQEQAAFEGKMAQIGFEKHKEADQMWLAVHRGSYAQYVKAEQAAENERFKLEETAEKKRLALVKGEGPKETTERAAINHKIEEQAAQHANNMVKITDDEEKRKLKLVEQAENKMGEAIAKTAASSIVNGKNMGQAFAQVGKQMIETALTNLLQMETVQGRKKLGDAKTAAADAYASAGNPVLGAVEAALAFTSVMAFAEGGTVPGSGHGDTVPAMLSPGETVVSAALTQQVKENTGGGSKGDTHHHLTYAPQVSAIDAEGVEGMLKKHATTFQKHVNATLRKQNKR